MENLTHSLLKKSLRNLSLTSMLVLAPNVLAFDDDSVTKELEKEEVKQKEVLDQEREKKDIQHPRYKKITLSDDRKTYTVNGHEEDGELPVQGETLYVKYKKTRQNKKSYSYKYKSMNDRDGFYLAYSAVTTVGDDIYAIDTDSSTEFDAHFSYRIQLAGLFVESPGLNSRRLHGLYASNAWGLNFYNGDNWSFDLYK
jgi:hypothetical protein